MRACTRTIRAGRGRPQQSSCSTNLSGGSGGSAEQDPPYACDRQMPQSRIYLRHSFMRKTIGLAAVALVVAMTTGGVEAQKPIPVQVFKDATCEIGRASCRERV